MNPDKRYLEIKEYVGEGYRPCIDHGTWRVAILRYISDLEAINIDALERHNETDEVFVLLSGRCILYIGEGDGTLETIHAVDMVPEKIYNIKKGVYHSHTLSRDAVVLIVENRDTGPTNSDRISLINEQRREIITLTQSLWGRKALNQP
ncbi:MAG: hypothetical protein KGY39_02775 [Anaerolineales bacterium]|nr:hypothetical protein [Anaerolineales bacterium]